MLAYDAVAGVVEFERLNRAFVGNLEVPIAATYNLASAAEAHKRIEKGRVLGKIALRVS